MTKKLNFNDLKMPRIKKTLYYEDYEINILNPIKEIKDKVTEITAKTSTLLKDKNGDININTNINLQEHPQYLMELFNILVEGIEFPKTVKEFQEVMSQPNQIVEDIETEIKEIGMMVAKGQFNKFLQQLIETEGCISADEVFAKLDKFSKVVKNTNNKEMIDKLNKLQELDKKEIIPKEKPKKRRKKSTTTKKKTVKEEEKVVELKDKKDIKGEE